MDTDDFENEDNAALYIEELRNDDPNLKINAVTKVASIAKILGPQRIKEELIPYLIEIIEEKDNEDEFLVKLIGEIAQIAKILGVEDSAQLLGPLEIMASMEEPTIRDKAVETLKQISNNQSSQFFSNFFINMIKRLALWDNYPSRVSACSLFYICYKHLSPTDRAEIRQLHGELAKDDTPMVRRAAAANIKNLVTVFEEEYIKSDLLPMFSSLIKDDTDSVKINALDSCIDLLPFYTRKEIRDNLILLLKNLDPENKSWRVRFALSENLIRFCEKLDKEVIMNEIYPIYENMLKDSEQEVRSCAIMKLPELCQYLDEIIMNKLVTVLSQLTSDSSLHVRLSLAQIISQIAKNREGNFFTKSLFPLLQMLFKDEITEVRSALIQNLEYLAPAIGLQQMKQHVIPLLSTVSNDKQWRSKLSLLELLPKISKNLGYDLFKDDISGLLKSFCTDHVQAIRNEAIKDLCELYRIFGPEKMNQLIEQIYDELLKSTNYLFRITALQALPEFMQCLIEEQTLSFLEKALSIVGNDKVPNVKFNLVKTCEALSISINKKQSVRNNVRTSLNQLKDDEDLDVSYFARTALEQVFE